MFGMIAFLSPWRRGELSPAGFALALQVWAFSASSFALGFEISTREGYISVSAGAQVAFVAALIALAGGVVRARWGALASAGSALALAAALIQMVQLQAKMEGAGVYAIAIPVLAGSGALVAWRTARSALGTLRGVLD
jgi:hypothetical protein